MDLSAILQDQNPWWREPLARGARAYPVRRDLQPRLLETLSRREERRAALVIGPRQVGKTVLLLQLADDLLDRGLPPSQLTYFDFSDDRVTEDVSPRQVVKHRVSGTEEEAPRVFLFDEIRLGKSWDRWLKQAVDRRVGRIVATDSAASLLRDAGRESGQGRWDEHRIEGLSFREFVRLHAQLYGGAGEESRESVDRVSRRLPNLPERYLTLGGFPEHALSERFDEVRRRLRSDIVDRAILRDLARFDVDMPRVRDLFVYLAQDSGALFNASHRASDLGADPRTVDRWVDLLEDTLLLARLPKHVEHAAARLRARSKIFAADPGLVSAFSELSSRDEEVRAKVFEAAVFRHLRDVARRVEGELGYFRSRDDLEVDFVLEATEGRVAIEVTSSSRPRNRKLARLRRAAGHLKTDRRILIYGGVIEEVVEGARVLPLQRFLLEPESVLESASTGSLGSVGETE